MRPEICDPHSDGREAGSEQIDDLRELVRLVREVTDRARTTRELAVQARARSAALLMAVTNKGGHGSSPAHGLGRLSTREVEVLHLLAHSVPTKLIGHRLGISVSTVSIHLTAIYRKLRVTGRMQAAHVYWCEMAAEGVRRPAG